MPPLSRSNEPVAVPKEAKLTLGAETVPPFPMFSVPVPERPTYRRLVLVQVPPLIVAVPVLPAVKV